MIGEEFKFILSDYPTVGKFKPICSENPFKVSLRVYKIFMRQEMDQYE